ncbi:MAG TPA: RNA polymerase sigma factor, partial [Terriglobia bacterium]|nr:RNA polymerase sigma factor [Terriglobia bacterium]
SLWRDSPGFISARPRGGSSRGGQASRLSAAQIKVYLAPDTVIGGLGCTALHLNSPIRRISFSHGTFLPAATLQQGSRDAFTELFARYRDAIYGFFRRRLSQSERAEELAQETFLAVLKGIHRYEPRAAFRAYLYGIAFNLLAAGRRKKPLGETYPQGTLELGTADPVETGLWVRQALEKLDASAREVLLLREYAQLSYAEIAVLLRLPVNTVRSRLFRARMAVKDLLVPQRGMAQGI